jgi:hypothetical protein
MKRVRGTETTAIASAGLLNTNELLEPAIEMETARRECKRWREFAPLLTLPIYPAGSNR